MKKIILTFLIFTFVVAQLSGQTAEELNEKLLLYSSNYGVDSPEYADCMLWCAMKCAEYGDNIQAKSLMVKSCEIFKNYGHGPFDGLDTINQILLYDLKSKLAYNADNEYMALQYSKRSNNLKKEFFGEKSEVYLQSLLDVSKLYAERVNYSKSFNYHHEAYVSYIEKIKTEFCSMSESERANYWNTASRYIYRTIDLNSATASNNSSIRQKLSAAAYDALLLSKGLLLNTTIDFENFVRTSNNGEAIKHFEEKRTLSAQYASQHTLDSMDYVILADLKARGQTYNISHLSITWRDVQEKLGNDDLAIEFFQSTTGEYGAILLKKNWKSPQTVKLKAFLSLKSRYDSMDEALIDNKLETSRLTKDQAKILLELGKAVWCDDIIKHFPVTREGKVYFSAAGRLQLVGIEYLPLSLPEIDMNGDIKSYYSISDIYDIYRISSTRELVLENDLKGIDAVIYGGLNYGMSADSLNLDAKKHKRSATRSYREVVNINYEYLPGTKSEAEAITETINNTGREDLRAEIFTGNIGTEAAFKELSGQRKQIIHIGTHGYYEPDEYHDNLLENSGLCFSGVNNGFYVSANTDDGILTAKEASDMDLRGLSIMTLSACETGLGSLSSDGVFGLQRGFKMAGANSILMSLWKVDDDATKVLMTEFYGNLMKGKTKRHSLEDARAKVRANPKWQSPQYWAAFILLDGLD